MARPALRLLASWLVAASLGARALRTGGHQTSLQADAGSGDPADDDFDAYTDVGVYQQNQRTPLAPRRGGAPANAVDDSGRIVEGPPKLLFFTHHKTGTFLMRQLALSLRDVLQVPMHPSFENRKTHPCNFTERIGRYQNMHENDFEVLRRDCPNFRAVHMVRSPLSLLASAYMYHKHTKDLYGMPTGPAKLANKSVYDGLRIEAEAITFKWPGQRGVLREMLAVHEVVKDDPRVLETDLAAFQADFDGTTRQVFTHLLGPRHPAINYLVEVSKAQDVARWSQERLMKNRHIHEANMKHVVTKAVEELLRIGDPAVLSIRDYNGPMGYDPNATAV